MVLDAVVVVTAAIVCELPTGPSRACAPASISLRITAGSLAGELSSSASMISIGRPRMPPAALISSTAIFTDTYSGANDDATRPVIAHAEPHLIVAPFCANPVWAPASREPADSVGAIALTVTPVVASSLPRLFVNAMTPPLAAEYAAWNGLPSFPAIDDTLMMRPQPRRIIAGANARQQ